MTRKEHMSEMLKKTLESIEDNEKALHYLGRFIEDLSKQKQINLDKDKKKVYIMGVLITHLT